MKLFALLETYSSYNVGKTMNKRNLKTILKFNVNHEQDRLFKDIDLARRVMYQYKNGAATEFLRDPANAFLLKTFAQQVTLNPGCK